MTTHFDMSQADHTWVCHSFAVGLAMQSWPVFAVAGAQWCGLLASHWCQQAQPQQLSWAAQLWGIPKHNYNLLTDAWQLCTPGAASEAVAATLLRASPPCNFAGSDLAALWLCCYFLYSLGNVLHNYALFCSHCVMLLKRLIIIVSAYHHWRSWVAVLLPYSELGKIPPILLTCM